MKLYGNPGSTCTRKVLTVLAEHGTKIDLEIIDLGKREQKAEAHLARQPFGQIPVLEDGDFRLYESRAIARYLDDTLPGPKLTPQDPKLRAQMEQWISVEMQNFSRFAMMVIYEKILKPMRGLPLDPASEVAGREGYVKCLDVLDQQLAGKTHVLGEQFTLADIGFMPYVEYLLACGESPQFESRPNVLAWWKNVSARPSWQVATGRA
jgi:glutathione S-transferase